MESNEFLKAAGKRDWHSVSQLLSSGVNVNEQHELLGWSALHCAADNGISEIVTELIQKNADVNLRDRRNWTPLHFASYRGHFEVQKELIRNGAEIDAVGNKGWTSLHLASQNGHADGVGELLNNGADVNKANNDGFTPLHYASQNGHCACFDALIDHGAVVDAQCNNGSTPLHLASMAGNADIVEDLLRNNAAVNISNYNGLTSLDYACIYGHEQVVQKLLTAGANVNPHSKTSSPLHYAVIFSPLSVVQTLLAQEPDLSLQSNFKLTPLSCACLFANIPALTLILHHMWQHDFDLSQYFSPLCATLAADCIHRLTARIEVAATQLPASRSAMLYDFDESELSELSEQLCEKMHKAGFHRTRSALQSAVADVLQSIERQGMDLLEIIFIVGSYSDAWGNSLRCMRGIIDTDSDLDVTQLAPGRQFHLKDRCTCKTVQSGHLVQYENGHVMFDGEASHPSKCYKGSRLRPAFDLVSAYRCCCYPHIEVIHNETRTTHLSPALLQSLRKEVTEQKAYCHLVKAAAPGQQGKQLRVSTTFLERKMMRSLTSEQGHLFLLLKYLIKKVISRKVKGLKTYHAKCLVFEMLDRTPAAQWQKCNLIRITKQALNLLLEYLQQSDSNDDECMKHFFLRDAAVYLKNGHDSKSEIAQQVKDTIHKLPELLQDFMDDLKEVEGHDSVFTFHPFLLKPDIVTMYELEAGSGELKYHDIYSAVHDVIVQLSQQHCSEQSVTALIERIPDCARTARESLKAMVYLKFDKRQHAVNVLQSYIERRHAVSRGIACPSTITADTISVDMVWQHLQQSDSAWKFCFQVTERPTFRFVSDFIAKTFPTNMNNYTNYWFMNFDALMKCLCLKLIPNPERDRSWFADVVRDEDADVQQLLMTLHYCSDVNVLVDLIHWHSAAIADQEETVNAVIFLMIKIDDLQEAVSIISLIRWISQFKPHSVSLGAATEALRLLSLQSDESQSHETASAQTQ